MKQRYLGKKLQNWHRPLRADQLRQRYVRRRNDDPSLLKDGQPISAGEAFHFEAEVDDYWNPFRWGRQFELPECESFWLSEDDWQESLRREAFNDLTRDLAARPLVLSTTTGRAKSHAEGSNSAAGLEESLYEHVIRVKSFPKNRESLTHCLRESIGDAEAFDAVASTKWGRMLWLLAPFWIRRPPRRRLNDVKLAQYLLIKHEVPGWLVKRVDPWQSEKHLLWMVILGQGGSLRIAGKFFAWRTSADLLRGLWMVGGNLSFAEAVVHSEIRGMGGSDLLANIIFRHYGDATEWSDVNDIRHRLATIQWLIKHERAVEGRVESILSWATHQQDERTREGGLPFSWRGRTPAATIARALEFENGPRWYQPVDLNWNGHELNWTRVENNGNWEFVELLTAAELREEGSAMNHCVASYARLCHAGHAAIVSVRFNAHRRLTIEVGADRKIRQVRGRYNREMRPLEKRVVAEWCHAVLEELNF